MENKGPESLSDSFIVFNGGTNLLRIFANDIDHENDSIYLDTLITPLNGKIENIDNELFYTANNNFTGVDSLFYRITDGYTKSGITKVNLVVKNGKFSSDPYFGNATNYTFYNTCKYDVLTDNFNNKVLAIKNDLSLPWTGAIQEYCIINNRSYDGYIIRLKARPIILKQWVEYAVIVSYKDIRNYCCIHFYYHDNTGRVQGFCIKDGIPQHVFYNDIDLFADTEFHNIEVRKMADSVSINFDKRNVGGTSDHRFLEKGAIGFGTKSNMVYFDDVCVTEN